jgi:hypothetical protein
VSGSERTHDVLGNFLLALAALMALKSGLVIGLFIAPDTVSFDSLVETATGATFLTTAFSVLLRVIQSRRDVFLRRSG